VAQGLGFSGIVVRFLIAFGLVCLTWNPTRYNYVEWTLARWEDLGPLVAFSGLVIFGGWIFFLRTTARSLGFFGIVMCTGLAVIVLWSLFFYNLVSRESTTLLSWIVLVLFSAILAAGMSWAHLRNRWSGQATVDDVDGN
jgi:FtsH-binding integral membrane protein